MNKNRKDKILVVFYVLKEEVRRSRRNLEQKIKMEEERGKLQKIRKRSDELFAILRKSLKFM